MPGLEEEKNDNTKWLHVSLVHNNLHVARDGTSIYIKTHGIRFFYNFSSFELQKPEDGHINTQYEHVYTIYTTPPLQILC